MRTVRGGLALLALSCLELACGRAEPERNEHANRTPVATAAPPSSTPVSSEDLDPASWNPRDLAAHFKRESNNRPDVAPRVEQVFEAFRKAGIPIESERQHLASPFGARFCMGAKVSHDISLSVCEFANAEAARSGREASAKALSVIRNRDVFANGGSTLTLRLHEETRRSQELVQRMREEFGRLAAH